ncbi:MAG: LPS assembly protein LptD [Rickettsiales bacterium]|nr:LPS assembly protein LptD [Rickettsiales bacterium]
MDFKKIIFCALFLVAPAVAETLDYKDIDADKIIYNAKTGDLKTEGRAVITSTGGQKMTLRDAYLTKTGADGNNIVLEWSERTLMTAETLHKDGDATEAENISYTACHGCDSFGDAWTIHATDMTHDAVEKNMYFTNFWFDVYGLPLLYLPWFSQPDPSVKKRTGLLLPQVGTTSDMGSRIDIPLYLYLDDNHDATITAVMLEKENPMFMGEHRLLLEHAEFDSTGSFTRTADELDRWHIFSRGRIDLGENMRLRLNINRTSDDSYLPKYGFGNDRSYLESNARLEVFAEKGYITAGANIFQDLRQSGRAGYIIPNANILPRLHGKYQQEIGDNLFARFSGDLVRIANPENRIAENRMVGEARLVAPFDLAWSRWTISGNIRGDFYQYQNIDAAPVGEASRLLPSGYIDWEMPFVKTGGDIMQIITPKARVTMLGKSEGRDFLNIDSTGAILSDSSLFSNNRYSGYDLWADGTYADYGITWTGFDSEGAGAEAFVGQTYDISANSPPDINSGYYADGPSDVVARLSLRPSETLDFTNRVRVLRGTTKTRHWESEMKIGNASYLTMGYIWAVQFATQNGAYVRSQDISEITAGFGVGLTERFALQGRGYYNLTEKMFQKYEAGLYYRHPCYELGLVHVVDNSSIYTGNADLNYRGQKAWKFKYNIKMGK